MLRPLTVHPDTRAAPVAGVEVEALRPERGLLLLRYRFLGSRADLLLPRPASPVRADGLWRHTCCEAFLRLPGAGAYWEFNFAPSSAWAAYRFDGYRSGMRPAEDVEPPVVATQRTEHAFVLEARLRLDGLEEGEERWRLGLSAVIEATDGSLSYWALAHPMGRPDFHHPDCFALELPAIDPP